MVILVTYGVDRRNGHLYWMPPFIATDSGTMFGIWYSPDEDNTYQFYL